MANDTINSLFDGIFRGVRYDLNEYLHEDPEYIMNINFDLKLKKAPELNNEFKVKLILELSTNEVYVLESETVLITN